MSRHADSRWRSECWGAAWRAANSGPARPALDAAAGALRVMLRLAVQRAAVRLPEAVAEWQPRLAALAGGTQVALSRRGWRKRHGRRCGSDTGGSGGSAAGGADAAAGAPALDASSGRPDAPSAPSFLHVQGNGLFDAQGESVRLTGVNWFGLETSNEAPHGSGSATTAACSSRWPTSNSIPCACPGPTPSCAGCRGRFGHHRRGRCLRPHQSDHGDLVGKTPLQIMDAVIAAAGEFGLRIILDNHSRGPTPRQEELWWTATTSEQQWIADWVTLATKYKGNPLWWGSTSTTSRTVHPPGARA